MTLPTFRRAVRSEAFLRLALAGPAGDGLGMWTALVGTLDQFEELGRALLGDVASLRCAAERPGEEAAG